MIDCHVHFWLYTAEKFPWITGSLSAIARDRLFADLAKVMPDKIEQIILIQAQTNTSEIAFLTEIAEKNAKVAGISAWFNFNKMPEPQIEISKQNKYIKGFRHIIQDELDPSSYLLSHQGLQTGMRAIQEAGLVYELLVRQTDLKAAIHFCQQHHQAPIIIDHLAKPIIGNPGAFLEWKEAILKFKPLSHVHIKISGLVTEGGAQCTANDFQSHIDVLLEYIGTKRLIWGSDWPVSSVTHSYKTLISFWDEWSKTLSSSEKELIERENAIALYKL